MGLFLPLLTSSCPLSPWSLVVFHVSHRIGALCLPSLTWLSCPRLWSSLSSALVLHFTLVSSLGGLSLFDLSPQLSPSLLALGGLGWRIWALMYLSPYLSLYCHLPLTVLACLPQCRPACLLFWLLLGGLGWRGSLSLVSHPHYLPSPTHLLTIAFVALRAYSRLLLFAFRCLC